VEVRVSEPRLVWKKSCDTCRKYKAALDAAGVRYAGREMNAEPLSAEDLRALVGTRPPREWLNTHNALYRERGFAKSPPTLEEALELTAAHNNLLRRPVLVVGETVLFGNDLPGAFALLGVRA
jgi:arsenate reductase-like glutaredoxin family protein